MLLLSMWRSARDSGGERAAQMSSLGSAPALDLPVVVIPELSSPLLPVADAAASAFAASPLPHSSC